MDLWRVAHDPKTGHRHELLSGFGHALVVPVITSYFAELGISASLSDGRFWWRIHSAPSIQSFELEHGLDLERQKYNQRMFVRAEKSGQVVRAEHAGYADFFVPIVARAKVVGILCVGPFLSARLMSADLLARWTALTRRRGHLADAEFQAYLTAALATLVLEGDAARNFEELLVCLAALMAAEGDASILLNRAEALHLRLHELRSVERTWDAAQSMIDDRFPASWSSSVRAHELRVLGFSKPPEQVAVGLVRNRMAAADPVEEALRGDAFQRAAVQLARDHGNAIAGCVGRHGIFLISSFAARPAERMQALRELVERTVVLGRRFGLLLGFGARVPKSKERLSRTYQAAFGAAEAAVILGEKLQFSDDRASLAGPLLYQFRRGLPPKPEESPELLAARFDRYIEVVAARTGYRIEGALGHLEAGFERLAEPLLASGALDDKSFTELSAALERAVSDSLTLNDLAEAYRRSIADLSRALRDPSQARRDRSLRRALDYMSEHYAESLTLSGVARLAGFTPSYFSKLFGEREGVSFVAYVARLRLERAQQLLSSTELDVERIAELCGFRSHSYFTRVFRRSLGMTPQVFRGRRVRRPRRKSTSKNS